jgi:hypothetical protein
MIHVPDPVVKITVPYTFVQPITKTNYFVSMATVMFGVQPYQGYVYQRQACLSPRRHRAFATSKSFLANFSNTSNIVGEVINFQNSLNYVFKMAHFAILDHFRILDQLRKLF